MKKIWMGIVLSILLAGPAVAMTTEGEYIDYLVQKISSQQMKSQLIALKRLQWSGIDSPALYDVVEKRLKDLLAADDLLYSDQKLGAYYVRALGYSGNEKYRDYVSQLRDGSDYQTVRAHAKKALNEMGQYGRWVKVIETTQVDTTGLNTEEMMFLKMLSSGDIFVQRLAARAMFHEHHSASKLVEKAAELIRTSYLQPLGHEELDTIAWLCKAVAVNGVGKDRDLLMKVAAETPHPKIAKYALKYM